MRRMHRNGAPALALAALLLAGAARAATLTVPGQYATIAAAISQAQPADIIDVAAGTYAENLTLPVSVSIRGAGVGRTILNGGAAESVVTVNPGYSVTLTGLTLTNGLGTGGLGAGGGVFNEGSLRIERCAIIGNSALNGGAGICNFNGDLTLVDCSITNNIAADAGGGIVNYANLTMQNCLVAGNVTGVSAAALRGIGGGIANSGALYAVNCTVSGNAAVQGGGIYNAAGSVTLESCTVFKNAAQSQGGGMAGLATTLSRNAIIAANTATSGPDVDGALTSYGHNFLGTVKDAAITTVAGYGGDILGPKSSALDPLLQSAPTDNGGPTLTCLPLAGSPVIDKGDPAFFPPKDARGVLRPQDGDLKSGAAPDIGAVELQATYVVTNANDVASGQAGYAGSLRAAIDAVNAGPGDAVIAFAIPGAGVRTIHTAGYLLTKTAFIDGWSQGGPAYKGAPLIELDGSGHPTTFGLNIQADGVTVRGLCINNFPLANAGNAFGIGVFGGSGAWIYGCFLGTDPTGTLPRPNGQGGAWLGSGQTTLGTNGDGVNDDAERNVISANGVYGVLITSSNNRVAGNVIGGPALGNAGAGVGVQSGTGNAILGNAIAFNGFDIDLGNDGHTPNHAAPAAGPNDYQNYPVLSAASSDGATTTVTATLNSRPSQTFLVEFFGSDAPNASGYGGGQRFLAAARLTTDAAGAGSVTTSFAMAPGAYLTATATDAAGNTSEFNAPVFVAAKPAISGSTAANVSTASVTLSAVVSAGGLPATVQLQQKIGASYTNVGPAINLAANANGPLAWPLANLPPASLLTYRVRASNAQGTVDGPDIALATLSPSSGDALSLDGLTGAAEIPGAGYNSFPLTVSAWIKTSAAQGYAGIVTKYANDTYNGWVLGMFGTEVHAWYMRNGSNAIYNAGTLGLHGGPVADGQWHHVAFVADAAGGRLYVDGVLKDSLAWTGTPGACTTTEPVRIGKYQGLAGPGNLFAGQVDEVRLWSTALTGAQVQATMAKRLAGSEPGLLADFRLDEGTGAAVADAVAGVSGTLSGGAAWVPSGAFDDRAPAAGSALTFNGSNSDVRVPGFGAVAPTTEVTIEFWQLVTSAKDQATFSYGDYFTGNRVSCHTPWSDGAVYWDFGNLGTNGRLAYAPPASIIGSWQHFALVASQSGNFMRIYRNGALEAQKTGMTPFIADASPLRLGAGGGIDFYGGVLEEFRVWNVARTQAQIQASMNRPLSGAEPGLVAYYPMDEGAGPAINDASGHGRTGYLENGPVWTPSGAPLSAAFTLADAARALRLFGGLAAATGADARLNVTSPAGVDLRDALSLARRAAGLDQ